MINAANIILKACYSDAVLVVKVADRALVGVYIDF